VPEASRLRALFLFTPLIPGADTWIQLLILSHLGELGVELHAAAQPADVQGRPSATYAAVADTPGVAVRPTNFGPSLFGQSRREKLASIPRYIPAVGGLLGLAKYVRDHRIDVIHSSDRPRDALACVLLARLTGAKSVVHVHVKYADWASRGARLAYARADAIIGVSAFVAQSLVEGGFGARKIHAVLNAIEPAKWDPSLSPAIGRASLGVAPGVPLILCVARIYKSKGQAELIDALARVRAVHPDVRLAIVGSDYPEGSGDTELLKQRAAGLGLAENVLFPGQRSDIPALMAACDVFCMPSSEEPFGLVFAEALAMKRPVVAIADGGTLEVVEHGQSGLLAAAGDVDTLAAHLLTLLGDADMRARMGEYGREQVELRFSPDRLASDVLGVYQRVLGRC